MSPIKVMINGLPGKVATTICEYVLSDSRFTLLPHALTGPEITERQIIVGNTAIELIGPDGRQAAIDAIKAVNGEFITIDFTHPQAVNANAEFYRDNLLPFVMGTTGGERDRLEQTVAGSEISAVIAPNMAKQIVGFQAMMAYAAENFPDLFKDYTLTIQESHQQTKADTSGTAKAMVRYFNALGIPFSESDIQKERDPDKQRSDWGIPEPYLAGHAWHTYSLVSKEGTVHFAFSHNVNGRDIYGAGTLDAIMFLDKKWASGERGAVYTMIDVLKGV